MRILRGIVEAYALLERRIALLGAQTVRLRITPKERVTAIRT